jgi:NAD(P)-dependent dehydrogenase (short-subunit alcohol dehydrogenase family)
VAGVPAGASRLATGKPAVTSGTTLTGPRAPDLATRPPSPARRASTPDEVATVGELLMTAAGSFITGSDILMDGGVTASYWYGPLNPHPDLASQST